MLIDFYNTITKMEKLIGNGAKVRLSVVNNPISSGVEIKVDWLDRDFHARYLFSLQQLAKCDDENLVLDNLIAWCKNEYRINFE